MKKILIPLALLLAVLLIVGRLTVKEVYTEIVIDAPAERVWQVLADVENYSNWNPFIRKISGELYESSKLKVTIDPQFGGEMDFDIKVGRLWYGREMIWIGRTLMTGLLDGRHYFKTEKLPDGKVKFINMENYSGLLLYPTWLFIEPPARKGFEAMNMALKAEAERL